MVSVEKHRNQFLLAIICLVYSGVALVLFINHAHFLVEQGEPRLRAGGGFVNTTLRSDNGTTETMRAVLARDSHRPELSTQIVLSFFGAVISLLAGLTLLRSIRTKETKALKQEVVASMILPDEKTVIRELKAGGSELTQSEIVTKTGLSKVKVHRVVKRLETLGIVKKYPYGMTNKIKLEKDLLEE